MTLKPGLIAALATIGLMGLCAPAMAQPADALSVIVGIGNHQFVRDVYDANDTRSVRVIRLSSLMVSPGDAGRLRDAEARHATAIADLQFQLSFNPAARFAVRNAGLTLSRIVSIEMDGHGNAIVYADDL